MKNLIYLFFILFSVHSFANDMNDIQKLQYITEAMTTERDFFESESRDVLEEVLQDSFITPQYLNIELNSFNDNIFVSNFIYFVNGFNPKLNSWLVLAITKNRMLLKMCKDKVLYKKVLKLKNESPKFKREIDSLRGNEIIF